MGMAAARTRCVTRQTQIVVPLDSSVEKAISEIFLKSVAYSDMTGRKAGSSVFCATFPDAQKPGVQAGPASGKPLGRCYGRL
jgi:hypothetical protein